MNKRISHIAPLQLGVVVASLYLALALLFLPFILFFSVLGAKSNGFGFMAGGVFFFLLVPVLYAMIGFIGGMVVALVYNFLAKWTGGIELTLTDAPQFTRLQP